MLLSVEDLLSTGTSPEEGGGFPIQNAALYDHYEVMELLLEYDSSVNLARWCPENINASLSSPLRLFVLDPVKTRFNDASSAEKKDVIIKMLLDRGLETVGADETSIDSLLTVAIIASDLPLINELCRRYESHQFFEQYITSGILALVGWTSPNFHEEKAKAILHY
jgi:hypothetical protein